jgi:hypothetical protein
MIDLLFALTIISFFSVSGENMRFKVSLDSLARDHKFFVFHPLNDF